MGAMPQLLTWNSNLAWNAPGAVWNGVAAQPNPNPSNTMNRVSASITDQDITDILAAVTTIRSKLPFLVSLSAQDRRELPKLGPKSAGFHEKVYAYMGTNPELIPGFVAMAEVTKDDALRARMMQFVPELTTLCEEVDDTLMVIASELWMADLAYYQNVREAAKRGLPGADTIYANLRERFPGTPRPVQPPPQPPAPPPPSP